MPMTREEHEDYLNQLNNSELSAQERTDILQNLRSDYGSVINEFNELGEKTEKLTSMNEDLTIANSKLFRQMGVQGDPEMEAKEKEETFSETVTLKDLEKGLI